MNPIAFEGDWWTRVLTISYIQVRSPLRPCARVWRACAELAVVQAFALSLLVAPISLSHEHQVRGLLNIFKIILFD